MKDRKNKRDCGAWNEMVINIENSAMRKRRTLMPEKEKERHVLAFIFCEVCTVFEGRFLLLLRPTRGVAFRQTRRLLRAEARS